MRDQQHSHAVGNTLGAPGTTGPTAALVALLMVVTYWFAIVTAGDLLARLGGGQRTMPPLDALPSLGQAWTPAVNTGLAIGIGVAIATAGWLAVLMVVSAIRGGRRTDRDAGWATIKDLKRAGLTARELPAVGRVAVGRAGRTIVATPRSHSLIVFGPSGSGKTSGFAIPAVLEWDGPALVSSVKTDLLRVTSTTRRDHGAVMVYDPLGRLGSDERVGWDLLGTCDTYEGAGAMAQALMGLSDFGTVQKGDFWQSSAVGLLGPLLLAAARRGGTVADVRRWLNTADWDNALDDLRADPEAAETLVGATKHTAKDTLLSYVASARVALQAYSTPAAIQSTIMAPQINVDELLDGTATLYLVGEEDDQELLRPLFVGLVDEIMRRAARRTNQGTRPTKPLLMLLDEAANSTPLPDLDRYASTSRDRGVQLVTIWQDLAQVEQRYNQQQARTILNNHQAMVLLPGIGDHTLLDRVSRLLGEERVTSRQRGHSHRGPTMSESESWRPLATPDELRRLDAGTALMLHGNTRAARLTLRPYYRTRQWRHLAQLWQPGDRPHQPTNQDANNHPQSSDQTPAVATVTAPVEWPSTDATTPHHVIVEETATAIAIVSPASATVLPSQPPPPAPTMDEGA